MVCNQNVLPFLYELKGVMHPKIDELYFFIIKIILQFNFQKVHSYTSEWCATPSNVQKLTLPVCRIPQKTIKEILRQAMLGTDRI